MSQYSYSLPASAVVPAGVDREREAILLTTILLVVCIVLQRLGVPVAGKAINLAAPLGVALALFGLLRGVLSFGATRLPLYLALCLLAALGTTYHEGVPDRFGVPQSMQSVLQFLAL